jgi:hypothetical protein
VSNLESKSASVDISISNINTFTASNAITSLNAATSSYSKLTGGNTFTGTQIISASVYVTGDFVVQGSSSIQYISASSVSIGTNIVQLNTNQPAVRFGGLSVQDSGSAQGVTGSMFWDGCCNRWIYSNPSGVGYSGGVLMSGPRGSTLGNEPTLTCNYIAKSGGGDHLYDSCIIDDGTTTCIKNNLVGTGTLTTNSTTTVQESNSANSTTIQVINTSNASTTTKTSQLLFQISDTANTIKQSANIIAIPEGVNVLSAGLSFGTRSGDSNPTERIRINSAGYVGISCSEPQAPLHIKTANGCTIRLSYGTNSGYAAIDVDSSNALIFKAYIGTEYMRINCSGYVGIGTNNPTSPLYVVAQSDTPGGDGIRLGNNGINRIWNTRFGTNTDLSYNLDFFDGASWNNRLKLTYTGYAGIGTSSPTAQLHICSAYSQTPLVVQGGGNGGVPIACFYSGTNQIALLDDNANLIIGGSSFSTKVTCTTNGLAVSGRVGIGTAIPATQFQIRKNFWQFWVEKSHGSNVNLFSLTLPDFGSAVVTISGSRYSPGADNYSGTSIFYIYITNVGAVSVNGGNTSGTWTPTTSVASKTVTFASAYAGTTTNYTGVSITIQASGHSGGNESAPSVALL